MRLLPAKDAFIQARDRDVLFPDPVNGKAVFPSLGGPGVALHEALPVATWRGAVKRRRYEVTVAPFAKLTKAVWVEIEAEAERVAHVRSHQAATVVESGGRR
ncbi:MAG: winged helix DNA-binding domain-containing protein [Actinomycetota bacterium]|nr:winged helix DNA-binding domain-containing protein [Actinomycetota bacterium]